MVQDSSTRVQAIISGGGGLAIALTVSISPLQFLCSVSSFGAAYLIGLGFRSILRRYCGTYVNGQYTGIPGSSLPSIVVPPVHSINSTAVVYVVE